MSGGTPTVSRGWRLLFCVLSIGRWSDAQWDLGVQADGVAVSGGTHFREDTNEGSDRGSG